jgi:hypothetical protein
VDEMLDVKKNALLYGGHSSGGASDDRSVVQDAADANFSAYCSIYSI